MRSCIFCTKRLPGIFDSREELLITTRSSLAQEESRSISGNVTWGHRKRMAGGKVAVACSRFPGYDKGEDGNLVVNPEETKTIRLIFPEFLSGLSCHAIADKLTDLGLKTPGEKINEARERSEAF